MSNSTPTVIRLADYQPPAFLIPNVKLIFDIRTNDTLVTSSLEFKKNPARGASSLPLELDGSNITLHRLVINGKELSKNEYQLVDEKLIIANMPEAGILEIVNSFDPYTNRTGYGLYRSGKLLCTQMEPEGFRRVTYFCDRPDMMSKYWVKIIADKKNHPTILANGNLIESGSLSEGRHYAVFEDPFAKPCYLFALVAGNLSKIEKDFKTISGRIVKLQVYCEPGHEKRCQHALDSLELALRWDEEKFGLEYDLDLYAVVAANDFNFGAMENKGLNIFNASLVLADPESAADADYYDIEKTIAHEAFHNYTGNRVTLRDWFQLTLKEGLTVFRDQEFSGDRESHALERLKSVADLWERQFPEDAGPNAHPIQPQTYMEIDNFYTATVYDKGAEVIRMFQTLLGKDVFNKAVRTYLKRFDGQAVTTEHFLKVMSETSGLDLKQFTNWYHQSGTPNLEVTLNYQPTTKTLDLKFKQSLPRSNNDFVPLHIPIAIGLVAEDGQDIPIKLVGEKSVASGTRILELKQMEQTFKLIDVPQKFVPSILRDFSAPVKLIYDYTDSDLVHLLKYDSDLFNRWQASQNLSLKALKAAVAQIQAGQQPSVNPEILNAFSALLDPKALDPSMLAMSLKLPSLSVLTDSYKTPDFDAAYEARKAFMQSFAKQYQSQLQATYDTLEKALHGPYRNHPLDSGKRLLKNLSLLYLGSLATADKIKLLYKQFTSSNNMTDTEYALSGLAVRVCSERDQAFAAFYDKWKADPVVLCTWLQLQAALPQDRVLERIINLEKSPSIDMKNPNHLRAIIGGFCSNLTQFHKQDGSGYAYLADKILEIDLFNSNIAAALSKKFSKFKQLDNVRKPLMAQQLERILAKSAISKGLYEIVNNTLRNVG